MPGGRVLAFPHERAESGAPPAAVTADRLPELVAFEPLRALAAEELAKGETVALLVGSSEVGARVETLLFASSGRGAQSTGSWVQRGLWNGDRLLTTSGHSLDRDAWCFCRACEAANAVELPDEE
jgi:hypothetical protein